jgi:putative intracellular protease/amidase
MMPALKIEPQATINEFDARFPEGADYVMVPAVHKADDATLVGWVRAQAGKGAVVIGICDGVWVVANAGLLSGHRATGHWYSLDDLQHKFTATTWIRNRRYVSDGSVVTTTGVTASIPASLALIEAIAGPDRAAQTARETGAANWSAAHDSNDFKLDSQLVFAAARNRLSFWSHDTVGISVHPGIDEVSLALVADAYSRTYRSQAVMISTGAAEIRSLHGLLLVPDAAAKADRMLPSFDGMRPLQALDWALEGIANSYGASTAEFVALQIEYPAQPWRTAANTSH